MKLYYYQFGDGVENFGDNLNAWLWKRLLNGFLDNDARSLFFGIGTLLNDDVAELTADADRHVVFSSGVGYGDRAPTLDAGWRVYCVRGPLSAQALGLPMSAAVTDGAMLVARIERSRPAKRWRYSFMPHIEQIADHGWRRVCREIGFGYIDPRWPTNTVLNAIDETETLVTEAMHGAIVADALRVPWIPVTTSQRILPFKWRDWCASVGVEYLPHRIATIVNPRLDADMLTPIRRARYWVQQQVAELDLLRLTGVRPVLTTDTTLDRVVSELECRLDRFKADADSGQFCLPFADLGLARHIDLKRQAA